MSGNSACPLDFPRCVCGVNDGAFQVEIFLPDTNRVDQPASVLGDVSGGADVRVVMLYRLAGRIL
jgi:hypothetical protein